MKVNKSIKVIIICSVLLSTNAFATVSGKQPDRKTAAVVSWYQPIFDFFTF